MFQLCIINREHYGWKLTGMCEPILWTLTLKETNLVQLLENFSHFLGPLERQISIFSQKWKWICKLFPKILTFRETILYFFRFCNPWRDFRSKKNPTLKVRTCPLAPLPEWNPPPFYRKRRYGNMNEDIDGRA